MPAPRGKVPAYCLHKASGRAVVRLNGRDHYLGSFGSHESHELYAKVISNWQSKQGTPPYSARGKSNLQLSINEVLLAYIEYAKSYYTKDGQPNKEYDLLRYAMRPLKALFGHSPAADFGPRDLKSIQQTLIEKHLSRSYINGQVNWIKRVFKWAIGEELVPPSVLHGLQAVSGLRRGRSAARETSPVRPVPDTFVEAVLPFVAPPVAAMIQLQRVTGMRSGELVIMRGCDIDTSGEVWLYTPSHHKNQWREQQKIIPLGPRAQEIVRPFLKLETSAYLFSPQDATDWHREQRSINAGKSRRTKVYPCELRRRMTTKLQSGKRVQRRPPRMRYDTASYRQAIKYGIQRANDFGNEIPSWHPHQLRHTKATELRRTFGLEAAQVALGHARADVTEIYAERNTQRAIELAKQTG